MNKLLKIIRIEIYRNYFELNKNDILINLNNDNWDLYHNDMYILLSDSTLTFFDKKISLNGLNLEIKNILERIEFTEEFLNKINENKVYIYISTNDGYLSFNLNKLIKLFLLENIEYLFIVDGADDNNINNINLN